MPVANNLRRPAFIQYHGNHAVGHCLDNRDSEVLELDWIARNSFTVARSVPVDLRFTIEPLQVLKGCVNGELDRKPSCTSTQVIRVGHVNIPLALMAN